MSAANGLLRFLTCGSVDDGKSTLIGRLLYDTKLIYEDQLAALERELHPSEDRIERLAFGHEFRFYEGAEGARIPVFRAPEARDLLHPAVPASR